MLGELRVISEPKVKFSRNKISFKQADFFKLTDLDVESESLFDPFNLHNTVNGTPITIVDVSELFNWELFFRNELLARFNDQLSGIYKYSQPTVLQIEFTDIPIIIDKNKDLGSIDLRLFRSHPTIHKYESTFQWTARRSFLEGFTKPDNYYRITGVISLKINFQSEILTSSDASSSGCIELITNSNGSPRLICILRRYVFKR